jgi:hypothetical protein
VSEISKSSGFRWTANRNRAALALAAGKTRKEAAEEAEVTERSVYSWLEEPEFSAEVDRLSLMTDIAGRAERLRLAKRAVRQAMDEDGKLTTKADVLDWLKYAQSETDGIKLDLTKLATALGKAEASVADRGSD